MYSSPPAGLSMPNSMFAHGPMVGPGAMAPIGPPQVAALPAGRAVPMPGGAPGDNLYGQAPAMTLAPQPPAAAGGGPPGFKPLWKPPLVNEPLIWVKGGDPVPPFAVYSRADSVKLVVSIFNLKHHLERVANGLKLTLTPLPNKLNDDSAVIFGSSLTGDMASLAAKPIHAARHEAKPSTIMLLFSDAFKEPTIEATKVRVKFVLPRKITMAPLHVSHTGGD